MARKNKNKLYVQDVHEIDRRGSMGRRAQKIACGKVRTRPETEVPR